MISWGKLLALIGHLIRIAVAGRAALAPSGSTARLAALVEGVNGDIHNIKNGAVSFLVPFKKHTYFCVVADTGTHLVLRVCSTILFPGGLPDNARELFDGWGRDPSDFDLVVCEGTSGAVITAECRRLYPPVTHAAFAGAIERMLGEIHILDAILSSMGYGRKAN
jgi:hypothetical protein